MKPAPSHHSHLLTPPGAGAIAVIRVTGPDPAGIVDPLFRAANRRKLLATAPGRLRRGDFTESGIVIDDIVACRVLQGDTEFVEICCHGGVRVVERILDALAKAGAPLAGASDTPWEGANRIEREALALLPQALTHKAVELLAWQRAHLAIWLQQTADRSARDPEGASQRLREFVGRAGAAKRILHGATVVLVGPPNSGKSTLFNRLVGRDAALVSPTAGTTRDWVGATVELSGVPVTLIDTAGRRARAEDLERIAIQSGHRAGATADLTLIVLDRSMPLGCDARQVLLECDSSRSILVFNKIDVPAAKVAMKDVNSVLSSFFKRVYISALTGESVSRLARQVFGTLIPDSASPNQPAAFTLRQVQAGEAVLELLPRDPRAAAARIQDELIGAGG